MHALKQVKKNDFDLLKVEKCFTRNQNLKNHQSIFCELKNDFYFATQKTQKVKIIRLQAKKYKECSINGLQTCRTK